MKNERISSHSCLSYLIIVLFRAVGETNINVSAIYLPFSSSFILFLRAFFSPFPFEFVCVYCFVHTSELNCLRLYSRALCNADNRAKYLTLRFHCFVMVVRGKKFRDVFSLEEYLYNRTYVLKPVNLLNMQHQSSFLPDILGCVVRDLVLSS